MPANLLDEPEIGTEKKEFHWTLNFGPQHPATHTTLRLVLELDGERIVKATPDIGYLHSGFEKLGEHLNFNQYVHVSVDRKNYISPPMNEVAWHHAVEKLLDVELTKRCQYIRVIIGELARISDHLLCVGAAASTSGRSFGLPLLLQPARADLQRLRGDVGYRFHPGYTRVGGGPPRLQRQGDCNRIGPSSLACPGPCRIWRSSSSATGSSSIASGGSAS